MEPNKSELSVKKYLLRQIKTDIGPITHEVLKSSNLAEAFAQIGSRDSSFIQQAVAPKLQEKDSLDNVIFAEKCVSVMKTKAQELSASHPEISQAITQYLVCLASWAEGAGISFIDAFALQDSNKGCETAIFRSPDGIVFAHAEEYDEGKIKPGSAESAVSAPKWTTFEVEGQPIRQAFTSYKLALPGSAFNFADGKFIVVDSLYIQPTEQPAFPANAAVWIAWQLGDKINTEDLIKSLSPYIDGYAINEILLENGAPSAKTIEFAIDQVSSRTLGQSAGDSLLQLGTISPDTSVAAHATTFDPDSEDLRYFDGLNRTLHAMRTAIKNRLDHDKNPLTLNSVKQILGFLGGNGKYVETSHKFNQTWVVGKLSTKDLTVEIGSGPLIQGELKADLRLSGKNVLELEKEPEK